MIQKIAVLGTGTIGASWAAFYASKGIQVSIFDANEDALHSGYKKSQTFLSNLKDYGIENQKVISRAEELINIAGSMHELLHEAEMIQESVTEDYGIKAEVYREIEAHASETAVLASSSSGLLITKMQAALQHPQRAIIAHPFNPPHLIPLVELVPGEHTVSTTVDFCSTFFSSLGKKPVILKKEIPGHIANRLAAAVWREAISLVKKDVASVHDIDTALHAGPGLRWAFMGPHLTYELGGGDGGYAKFLDIFGKAFSAYWKDMANWHEIPEDVKATLVHGVKQSIGLKDRSELYKWRDQQLANIINCLTD